MAEIIRSMNLISVFKQEKGVKRFFMMIFSILLMGFGISLFSYSDMGVDPFTSMNMAISSKIGISFGFYQMCINCVILIAIAFLGRHLIGFGTVVNMVGVGYICEFFTSLYDAHLPVEKSLALRLVLMLFGVIFLSLAAALQSLLLLLQKKRLGKENEPGGISISLRTSLKRPRKPLRFSWIFPV